MTKHLLKPKDEFEVFDYLEKAGMISVYVCSGCKMTILYSYIASGITPVKITCVECGELAWVEESNNIQQPHRVWYRPNSIHELERLSLAAYTCGFRDGLYRDEIAEDVVAMILEQYVAHYNKGGLFAKILHVGS